MNGCFIDEGECIIKLMMRIGKKATVGHVRGQRGGVTMARGEKEREENGEEEEEEERKKEKGRKKRGRETTEKVSEQKSKRNKADDSGRRQKKKKEKERKRHPKRQDPLAFPTCGCSFWGASAFVFFFSFFLSLSFFSFISRLLVSPSHPGYSRATNDSFHS